MIIRLIIFLAINFGGLAIGGLFTRSGVVSDWYQNLNTAPWTPPGWMFGAAWTTIMLCFSVYMMYAFSNVSNKKLLISLFVIQWLLNVAWNPMFFKYHQILPSFMIIIALTVSIGFILIYFHPAVKTISLLLMPYFIWLLIATSLNFYILLKNP